MKVKMRWKNLSWRIFFLAIIAFIFTLAAVGCGTPEKPASSGKTDQTTPSSAASTAAGSGSAEGKGGNSASGQKGDWEQVVESAKKEGKVVLSSAPSEIYRRALVEPFEKKYPEIKVDYTGVNGADFWPRVIQEKKIGQNLWDLSIIGVDAIGWDKSRELIDPIRPLLLPENADDTKWMGGLNGLFMDKSKQYAPGFLAYAQTTVSVNRDFISEAEIQSPKQLLDPKFKGKMVILDPRGGAGLGSLAVLMAEYGEEYIRDLLSKQGVVVTKDNRQLVEWVVRGRYPIGIGFDSTNLPIFQEKGVGLNIKDLEEGPVKMSRGFSATTLIKDAPHPNAAKVYINWLLSKEGQEDVSKLLKLNSRRSDVEPVDKSSAIDVKRLERYIPHQSEELNETRKQAQKIALELIKN